MVIYLVPVTNFDQNEGYETLAHRLEHFRRRLFTPIFHRNSWRVNAGDPRADSIPHLDSKPLPAVRPSAATDEVSGIGDHGGAELSEFLAADVVVIGAPMYNFIVPSQLKSRPGSTNTHRRQDLPLRRDRGLAGGKRVIIASSRDGLYAPGMPFEANDFQERYLRAVFAFIGIDDIGIVRAEGLALGPERSEAAIRAAQHGI